MFRLLRSEIFSCFSLFPTKLVLFCRLVLAFLSRLHKHDCLYKLSNREEFELRLPTNYVSAKRITYVYILIKFKNNVSLARDRQSIKEYHNKICRIPSKQPIQKLAMLTKTRFGAKLLGRDPLNSVSRVYVFLHGFLCRIPFWTLSFETKFILNFFIPFFFFVF